MNNLDNKHKEVLKEHISPEGIEEKIITSLSFKLTQTQGGKFRIYQDDKPFPEIFETEEVARKALKSIMSFGVMLIVDKSAAIGLIVDGLIGKKK